MLKEYKVAMATNLRTARREKGETQEETANSVGVTPSAYAMYETGNRIPRDEVKFRLADHFGKTVSELFFSLGTHSE